MATIGHLFAYGQRADGSLLPQTEARCRAAVRAYRSGEIDRITITAGIGKAGIPIAEAMRTFLVEQGVDLEKVIVPDFSAANTTAEIETALLFCIGPEDSIVAISSWYHLPRIWWLYRVRGRRVALISAWGGVSLIDLVMEPLKLLNNIVRPFAFKFTAAP